MAKLKPILFVGDDDDERGFVEPEEDDYEPEPPSPWEQQTEALTARLTSAKCPETLALASRLLTAVYNSDPRVRCSTRGETAATEAAGLAIGGKCKLAKKKLSMAVKACKVKPGRVKKGRGKRTRVFTY